MRPTAAESARSEWLLKTKAQHAREPPTEREKAMFQAQQLQSHLKTMALHCVTSQLNLSQLEHMNLRFQQYDSSGDGRLSHVEMRSVLEDVGIQQGEEMELLIEALDSDHSGVIEYSEFISGSLDVASEQVRSHLRVAFDVFDLDGNGCLSLDELRKVLTQGANSQALPTLKSASSPKGRKVPPILPDGKTVEEVMAEVDKDKSGKVEFKEFEKYLLAEHKEVGRRKHAWS